MKLECYEIDKDDAGKKYSIKGRMFSEETRGFLIGFAGTIISGIIVLTLYNYYIANKIVARAVANASTRQQTKSLMPPSDLKRRAEYVESIKKIGHESDYEQFARIPSNYEQLVRVPRRKIRPQYSPAERLMMQQSQVQTMQLQMQVQSAPEQINPPVDMWKPVNRETLMLYGFKV